MSEVTFGEDAQWKANQMPPVESKYFSLIVAVAEFNNNNCECQCENCDRGITIDDMYDAYLQIKTVVDEEAEKTCSSEKR